MCTEHQILCSNSTCCSKYQSRAAGCRGNGTPVQYSEQQLCQSLDFSIFFYFPSFRSCLLPPRFIFFVCVACVTGKPWSTTIRYCSMPQVHLQGLCHRQTRGRGCGFFSPQVPVSPVSTQCKSLHDGKQRSPSLPACYNYTTRTRYATYVIIWLFVSKE